MNDNENPYLAQMAGHDTHEEDMVRIRRYLSAAVGGLFLLLSGSLYGNVYQMRQVKEVHHITSYDSHGRPVSTLLPRAEEISEDNPLKKLIIRRYVEDYIENLRSRPMDIQFLGTGLNTAKRQTIGPATGLFNTAYAEEDPWTRIKNERVQIEIKGAPIRLTRSSWIAEWNEKVTNQNGNPVRIDELKGRFTLVENSKLATDLNPLGLGISDWETQKIGE